MSKENLSKITRAVVSATGIPVKDIKSKSREQPKVFARMLISYIAYDTYSVSQTEIADFLKIDQPSVSHYLKTISLEFKHNKELTKIFEKTLLNLYRNQAPKTTKPKEKKDYSGFLQFCEQHIGITPVMELKFHPVRKWRFDFAFPNQKIAVEVEGGVWTQGRHTRGSGFVGDMEKYNQAVSLGWSVLRTMPNLLETQQTIELIKKTLESKNLK